MAAEIVYNTCQRHGLSISLKAGKTEAIIAFRGTGAKQRNINMHIKRASTVVFKTANDGPQVLRISLDYAHLGGNVDHKNGMTREIALRHGQALAALRPTKKRAFNNENIKTSTKALLM